MKKIKVIISVILAAVLISCQQPEQTQQTQETITPEATIEATTTPKPTEQITPTPTAEPELLPAPEGEILFSSERGGDRDLYMMNADGSNMRCILDLPSIEGHADFAPDGQRIAFFSNMHGNRDIYVIDLRDEEMNPVQLTDAKGSDNFPDWSPDGEYIVFESARDGGQPEIYIMNADGRNQRRLTENSVKDKQPKFSKDGTVITYTTEVSGAQYMASIQLEDVLSSDEIPKSTVLDKKHVSYVDWSPDNTQIAYHGLSGSKRRLYIMDAETYEETEILKSNAYTLWIPVFSPDGQWIAFNKEKGYSSGDIYIMSIDGSTEYQLTTDKESDWGPEWRPELNRKIIFDSDRDGDREIFMYETKTDKLSQLTDNRFHDGIPYWSPDGTEILFFSNRDGDDEIYVMNADGTNVRQLTHNDCEDRAASWSHNGKYIVFSSNRDGDREIFIMKSDGSRQTQLTFNSAEDFWPEFSKNDKTITYTYFGDSQDTYAIDVTNWEKAQGFTPWLIRQNCSRCQFSPDGKRLAYSTRINSAWQIAVCDADGKNEVVLTEKRSNKWVPTWLDEEHLIYSNETGYEASIRIINIETLEKEVIIEADSQNWRPICYTE